MVARNRFLIYLSSAFYSMQMVRYQKSVFLFPQCALPSLKLHRSSHVTQKRAQSHAASCNHSNLRDIRRLQMYNGRLQESRILARGGIHATFCLNDWATRKHSSPVRAYSPMKLFLINVSRSGQISTIAFYSKIFVVAGKQLGAKRGWQKAEKR